jgi:hypothetical protein
VLRLSPPTGSNALTVSACSSLTPSVLPSISVVLFLLLSCSSAPHQQLRYFLVFIIHPFLLPVFHEQLFRQGCPLGTQVIFTSNCRGAFGSPYRPGSCTDPNLIAHLKLHGILPTSCCNIFCLHKLQSKFQRKRSQSRSCITGFCSLSRKFIDFVMSWSGPVAGAAPYQPQFTNSQPTYGAPQPTQYGQQPTYGQYPPGPTYPTSGPPHRPPTFQ